MMTSTSLPSDVTERLQRDKPAFHAGGTLRWYSLPETLEAIRASVKPGDLSVETGTGASTVVFAASGANHTAISPDPDEHQRIRAYCHSIGVDDSRLTFIAERSEDVLPGPGQRAHARCGLHRRGTFVPVPGGGLVLHQPRVEDRGSDSPRRHHDPFCGTRLPNMLGEHNWRFERVLDNRAAAFTLLAPPDELDNWDNQIMNRRYPDFSYAPLLERVRLTTAFKVNEFGRGVAHRSPTLRRVYKGIVRKSAKRSGVARVA